ncbi:M28 family peptidase [uncultured Lacinutrix sp.]|uniref:M28 family peptidase n=1 Tax=uncultured Lacinutrix sp. TaxID=574032 RepID=UPI00262DEED2|nr:M28 family peptidase [uncultured Lacinutrix sp.]
MKNLINTSICFFVFTIVSFGQTIVDVINQVNIDSLTLTIREFSGEEQTIVNGNAVTILNRQQANNDLAADYLVQRFQEYNNLTVVDQPFNTNGRNIIATQLGQTSPNNIYMICAHYDSVANYCADDNASGTTAVIEIARILSEQCLDNTIVYALWDEEEIGLLGSNFYANLAQANGDNILGVLNIDMMGYDGDNDNDFDVDVRQGDTGSIGMGNDVVAILNNPAYGFNLNVNVVNPGTSASDHASFWNRGFPAVLVGESWENNDQTPFYHSSGDRFSTLDLPYYHQLTKIIMGYMVTKGGLVNFSNLVTVNSNVLTANQVGANYQWINCDNNMPIAGETNQSFTATVTGNYAVQITSGSCTETSDCIELDLLGVEDFEILENVNIYPNPATSTLNIDLPNYKTAQYKILNINGKTVLSNLMKNKTESINISSIAQGVYFIELIVDKKIATLKFIKN